MVRFSLLPWSESSIVNIYDLTKKETSLKLHGGRKN